MYSFMLVFVLFAIAISQPVSLDQLSEPLLSEEESVPSSITKGFPNGFVAFRFRNLVAKISHESAKINTDNFAALTTDQYSIKNPIDAAKTIKTREYTYVGQLDSSGKMHGVGVFTNLKRNFVYEGSFKDNMPHGCGNVIWANRVFEGCFKMGKYTGVGIFRIPSENFFYEGQVYSTKNLLTDGSFEFHGYGEIHGIYKGIFERHALKLGTLNQKESRLIYRGQFKKHEDLDMFDGKGCLNFNDGDWEYIGEFKNGLFHGYGVLFFSNGDVYHGNFANGMYHGDVQFIFATGALFQGKFSKNSKLGFGVMITSNGYVYEAKLENNEPKNGKFPSVIDCSAKFFRRIFSCKSKPVNRFSHSNEINFITRIKTARFEYAGTVDSDEKKHGHGIFTDYEHRFEYNGTFFNDKPDGCGVKVAWFDESFSEVEQTFEGCINDGKINSGMFIWPERNIRYQGQVFSFDLMKTFSNVIKFHGYGELHEGQAIFKGFFKHHVRKFGTLLLRNSGKLYQGQFESYDDYETVEGKGLVIFSGGKYVGEFKKGRYHGYGVLITNTDIFNGDFSKGKFHGDVLRIPVSLGDLFLGKYFNGLKHGFGIMVTRDGNIYEGKYKNNELNNGKLVSIDSFEYNGDLNKEGKRHGFGRCVWSDGTVYQGKWLNDTREVLKSFRI